MLNVASHVDPAALKCYHCGDDCRDESIHLEDHVFCCTGCKTVYEILNENALCDYYSLESNPGIKVKNASDKDYAYLDDEKIKQSILNFQEGGVSGVTFYIPSIHCSSCIWLLENLRKINSGVISSTIHFQRKELDVQFNSTISVRELASLLSSIGYAPLISLNGKTVNNKSVQRSLYYKLGIAGFCFGNIMMLSLPEYLSVFDEFKGDIKSLFTILNLVLALPVFFYSASDYFISSWQAIKNKVINIDLPIALGLVGTFSQSVYEIISGTGAGYLDSLSGLVFFLLIGKWFQNRTYEALSFERDYKSYFPLAATKIENGKEKYVTLDDLKSGDIILIKNQEIIPADGIVLEGDASIDYSFVTGESVPVPKKSGQQIFAGGRQTGSAISIKLTREVSQSYLTQLWNKDNSKNKTSGLTELTNKVGMYFTIAVLAISGASYLYWVGKDSSVALYAAVTVLIIFCPCIFSLAIPFCFGNAMNILGRNKFFLKNTQAIERLANNDVLVFDKTGTITYSGESEVDFEGPLSALERQYIKSLAKNSTHPLAKMIAQELSHVNSINPESFQEIPAQGIVGKVEGNLIKLGSAAFVELKETESNKAYTRVYVSINGVVKGSYKFTNKYREGFGNVLDQLGKYDLHLLSGDNDAEKKFLSAYFKTKNMYFGQSPSDKLNYVQKLSSSHKVIMVGDGLNDAGALLQSNCGISITENSGSFSPACDAILEASQFEKLPAFLKYAKSCLTTLYWSLGLALCYNIVGLYFAVQGKLQPLIAAILMPLSSISVILFVTIMSSLLAKRYKL